MSAGRYVMQIEQGATWRRTFTATDGNNAAITNFAAPAALAINGNGGELIRLTDTAGITVTGSSITVTLTKDQTAALPAGTHSYDLFINRATGDRVRLLAGPATVTAAVSK